MAQMTVAWHFRVSIRTSLGFSASMIIEKSHSDRTFVLLPSGCFGLVAISGHFGRLEALTADFELKKRPKIFVEQWPWDLHRCLRMALGRHPIQFLGRLTHLGRR